MAKSLRKILLCNRADEFESEMAMLNFEIGKFMLSIGSATQIICPNEDEMLRHSREYNDRTNYTTTTSIPFVKIETKRNVIKTVLFKEVNNISGNTTYQFQKDPNTIVKLTISS